MRESDAFSIKYILTASYRQNEAMQSEYCSIIHVAVREKKNKHSHIRMLQQNNTVKLQLTILDTFEYKTMYF